MNNLNEKKKFPLPSLSKFSERRQKETIQVLSLIFFLNEAFPDSRAGD